MPIRRKERTQSSQTEAPAERDINSLPVRSAKSLATYRSYVIYGRSGTGKTTLAETFPGPKLLLDVRDHGTDSIVGSKDTDILDVEDWEQLDQEVYWFLKQHPDKYKTVIIDTITQAQEMRMQELLAKKKKNAKRAGEWGSMTRQEFGQVSSSMKTMITNYRDLKMNVVFIAQQRVSRADEDDADVGIDPEIGPQLMPSIAGHLNASVSIIGNMFIREVSNKTKGNGATKIQHCLFIGPDAVRITKTRKAKSVKVPPMLVDPVYEDLIETLKGE